jgi:hypothetical protein
MEQVKVLSAALALGEFTVDELVALSGVNASSVRSVLKRSPELVHRVGPTTLGRRGRPSIKWATTDSAEVRKLAAELEALPSPDPRPAVSPADRRQVAVNVAERAMTQVIDTQDFNLQQELLASAQASLGYADEQSNFDAAEHWWHDDPSLLAVRARGVDALATFAAAPHTQVSYELLARTTSYVAAAIAAAPDRGDAVYFAPFSQLLAAKREIAPVLWLSHRHGPPPRVGDHWSPLHTSSVDFDDALVYTQTWAMPLLKVSAPLPMVLASAGPAATPIAVLSMFLERTRSTRNPAVVLGRASQTDVFITAGRWGASFVPVEDWRSANNLSGVIYALLAVIDRSVAPNLLEMTELEPQDS